MCNRRLYDESGLAEYVDAGLRWLDRRIEEQRPACGPVADELREALRRFVACEHMRTPPRRPAGPVRWV